MSKLTKRQEDVLLNIHLRDQAYDGERTRKPFEAWHKRAGDPVEAWGRPVTHQRSGRAGGARYRMVERIADAGFIPYRETRTGRSYPNTGRLTSKGARHLADRYPTLPGILETLAKVVELEEEEERKSREALAIAEGARLARSEERSRKRRELMAAVLQDFQVRHDLTGDQLEAMWLRIVGAEIGI